MPEITFLPDNITITVPEGASLLEAARLAGVFVETPCGGRGACGKCAGRVVGGAVDFRGNKAVSVGEDAPDGMVLICRAFARNEAVTVELPKAAQGEGKFDFDVNISQYLPESRESFLKSAALAVAPPGFLDGLSDLDRFSRAFREAAGLGEARLPLDVLAELPEKLRENGGKVTVFYYEENGLAKVVDVVAKAESDAGAESIAGIPRKSPFMDAELVADAASETDFSPAPPSNPSLPAGLPPSFGVAVDIGTTTVALWLADMDSGAVLASHTAYNAQIECGLDVISRINYARKYRRELKDRVLGAINELISRACLSAGAEPGQIRCASLAGNTTMIHLLLGVVPEYIRLAPYTPAVFELPVYTAGEVGLGINHNAPALFAPAVGSYVGGDITSGALCTGLARGGGETVLFIDIGTNGEILLGNGEFIFGCACSAGPAFEGGGIKRGVRASAGAVERVVIDPATGRPEISVIGGVEPAGICGSGIISLTAGLFRNGLIDSAGKFTDRDCAYILRRGRSAEYALCDGITVGEPDIDNFIRAKGAVFSACQTVMDSVGLTFADVDKVIVAGGFGRFLNLEDARTVGLLPRLPDEKFEFLGNTSLTGAYLALISEERRAKELETARRITYVDLSGEAGYMDKYMAALFLPHTDMGMFE